jgi:hypothetical protein
MNAAGMYVIILAVVLETLLAIAGALALATFALVAAAATIKDRIRK